VGPVYFSDLAIEVPLHTEQAVAVFDIQPHRKSLAFGTSTIYEYYYSTPMVHRRFLEDVYEALSAAGLFMALKAKRDIGAKGEKTYQTLVNRLAKKEDVITLPPGIAAPRLMQACIGAISSPFTSTALYFKNQGYPSVYYDPLGVLYKNDPASHGLTLLNSKAELQDWVDGLTDVKLANKNYGK
jgi:polysaccharide biosynthesis PFTS motif protein